MLANPMEEYVDTAISQLAIAGRVRPSKHHNKKKLNKEQRNKRNRVAKLSRKKNRK